MVFGARSRVRQPKSEVDRGNAMSALARSYEPLLVEFLGYHRKLISNLGRRIGWCPYDVIPPAAKLIITRVI